MQIFKKIDLKKTRLFSFKAVVHCFCCILYSCQLDWSGAKQVSVVSFLIIDRAAREYILQHAIAIYFVGQDHQTSMSCLSAHAYIDGSALIYYP